jgi:D-sedoheptulose 7-phosphate isomerase
MKKIRQIIKDHQNVIDTLKNNLNQINDAKQIIHNAIINGNKIIFFGNGGSASDAQHLSAELIGRFLKERKPLASISLSTDTSALTAIANDYGYSQIFSRQIEGIANEGDILIGISTSGNSDNIIKALSLKNNLMLKTIGLLGKNGGLAKDLCDIPIIVDSKNTARIQEAHILIGHIICELIDNEY